MTDAFKKVAQKTSEAGVRGLQKGVNTFGLVPELKVDDYLGPKTTSRTKESLVKFGLSEVSKRVDQEKEIDEDTEPAAPTKIIETDEEEKPKNNYAQNRSHPISSTITPSIQADRQII